MTITDLPTAGRAAPIRAREHIRYLQGYGLSHKAIASLCNVSVSLIAHLQAPPGHPCYRRFIYTHSERLILAGRFDLDRLPDHVQVDVAGTRRRLQALACLGWSQVAVADMLGVDHTVMSMYVTGRRTRTVASRAREVRDLYAKLSMRLGDSPQAAGHAKAEGWVPPWAWDDETMDHPETVPDLDCLRRNGRRQTSEETLEDIAFLLRYEDPSMTMRQLGERLGVTRDAVARVFIRATEHAQRRGYSQALGEGCQGPLTEEQTEEAEALVEAVMVIRRQVYDNTEAAGFPVSQRAS